MKINKLKLLQITLFCFFGSLWLEAKCMDTADDLHRAEKILNNRPADMRYRIGKTEEWPNCLFGQVTTSDGSGSGTLVASNIVLTAAHVLYDQDTRSETNRYSIYFYPARSGAHLPYGRIKVTSFYYPEAYKTDGRPSGHDWALLILEEQVGLRIQAKMNRKGWFNLRICNEVELLDRPIHIVGYPGEKPDELWAVTGAFRTIETNIISYKLDTTSGQSGGGVWTEFNGDRFIIAAHQGGKAETWNWATRWTIDKHQKYLELGGEDFPGSSPTLGLSTTASFFAIRESMIDECINQYKILTKKNLTYRELADACLRLSQLYQNRQKVNKERNKEDMRCDLVLGNWFFLEAGLKWGREMTQPRLPVTHPSDDGGTVPCLNSCVENIKKDVLESMGLYIKLYGKIHPRFDEFTNL